MIVDKIKKNNFCLGCGLCASVLGKEICHIRLTEQGFYSPQIEEDTNDSIVKELCPGIKVHYDGQHGLWGSISEVYEGWSTDTFVRQTAASGGIVTSIAIFLLESKKVDAVLQVGVKDGEYLHNELKISRNRQDVIKCAQSRYAPALTLNNIKQILDDSQDVYAFIGKPCDITGVKNLIEVYPQYKTRIRLFVSIFCAGMPSYKATERAWSLSGKQEPPISLNYRGDGWPGFFKAVWQDGSEYKLSYNESWGKILGRDVLFRCKICPDGIGLLADIAVGDSWNTKDGYPDFNESEGRSLVFVRTERGLQIISSAQDSGIIATRPLEIEKIRYMQPYQYQKRKMLGWRILPIYFLSSGILDFKGFDMFRSIVHTNVLKGLKVSKGTIARFKRNRDTKK